MVSELVISFTIGPYYLDKNAESTIHQDAGCWMLVTGYSMPLIQHQFLVVVVFQPRIEVAQK
jgi:hypothetical protein